MPNDPKGLSLDQVAELVKGMDWLSFWRFIQSVITAWKSAVPKRHGGQCDPECCKAHFETIKAVAECGSLHCG